MTLTRTIPTPSGLELKPICVDGTSFALNGKTVSYRFHVDEKNGELISDHFGGLVTEDPPSPHLIPRDSFATGGYQTREFPDMGRGDFRVPAVIIKHEEGSTVTAFKYQSHTVLNGKPVSDELPGTFGDEDKVSTLVIHMLDPYTSIAADISYSVFPEHDAIVRKVEITNKSQKNITVEKLASFSVDLPCGEYDMIGLRGEWSRERNQFRRRVDYGTQGFANTTGYSSHFFNPFLAITSPITTETQGEAYGFSLVYTGSFVAEVEKSPRGLLRASMGMNNLQLSWPLKPEESLSSPECVAIYSDSGLGSMSRKYHRLYRRHLIKSKFVDEPRPTLLNSWEGLYFNFDEDRIEKLASAAADLGVKLFVLDDGWFGVKHPRIKDTAGLGDWKPNPDRFPNGLKSIIDKVNKLKPAGTQDKLQFGLWVEPEMVNPKSELYENHPEWLMKAEGYPSQEARHQLVLNVGLPEVQDYIIDCISALLEDRDSPISYIKWDNNRPMHETPSPQSYHKYMLGMYRVFKTLTSRYPDVLWEGCGAGGGRFDPGVLQYFPQIWTSDNMDPLDRIKIQFGTSLVYPMSTMGAHVGAIPSHVTKRTQSLKFRAHVALMGGSFGLELDPEKITAEEREQIPGLIALSEKINPIIIKGDLWRLRMPEDSEQDPAALVISEDGSQAVLFAFRLISTVSHESPFVRLQGLDPAAKYKLDGGKPLSGATLMNGGIKFEFNGDYDSKVVLIEKA